MQKNKIRPYTKINPKWIKNLIIKPKVIKLLEKKQENTAWHQYWCLYFGVDTKTKATRAKITKWNYMKLEIFHTTKETINRKKR